jgi:hypothetical protein
VIRRLKPVIYNQCRGLPSKEVVLLHNNTCLHSVAVITDAIRQLKFLTSPTPPYSPDLAPSDYYRFGPLNKPLYGCGFFSDDELNNAVHIWLLSQTKTFFTHGIKRLVNCYTICIEKGGDYVDK